MRLEHLSVQPIMGGGVSQILSRQVLALSVVHIRMDEIR